jgi:hypothetical protein
MLERIRAGGLAIAVATSAGKKDLRDLLAIEDLGKLIEVKVSKDHASASKPDPDVIVVAVKKLGLGPLQVFMIGDTPYDAAASRRAGVGFIGFRCGGWGDEDLAGAVAIYDGPADLLARYDSSPLGGDRALPDLLAKRSRPRPNWQRVLLFAGAIVMFLVGIVGWLVPVVTGIPFYIAGLVMLGMASKRFRDYVNRLERKLQPHTRIKVRKMLGKLPARVRKSIRIPPDLRPASARGAAGEETSDSGPSSPSATPARSQSGTPGRS